MNKVSYALSCLFGLFASIVAFSQQAQLPNDLPNFTPPSPEASAFTKYGNLDINESTGKATASIPLYTYSAGKLKVPISLNYIGNGVKVDANNTWTGVNWTLNVGGIITRTVFHNPDEQSIERIFKNDIEDLGLVNSYDNAEDLNSFYNGGGTWDTQPDIFTFSFAGYSGSFYLRDNDSYASSSNPTIANLNEDNDLEPVLINNEFNLVIEIIGPNSDNRSNLLNHKKFRITTPDGVQYSFGGITLNNVLAFEETSMEQGWHSEVTPPAVTSFYLTEIKHPISGIIYFDYDNVNFYRINTTQNRELVKYLPHYDLGFYNGCGEPPNCEPVEYFGDSYGSSVITNRVYNGKFLSKIFSFDNSIEVNFNSDDSSINGMFNFQRVLNSIEVQNNNQLINQIDFEYIYDYDNNIAQRFFLDNIEFDKDLDRNGYSNQHDYKRYKFIYNNPTNLPARFSASQDALGFYNGKNNADGLIPDVNDLPKGFGSPYSVLGGISYATADRSTDFIHKSIGVLEKIYYPTGGYTLFEYESNIAKAPSFKNLSLDVFINNYPLEGGNGATHVNKPINSIFIGDFEEIDENGNVNSNKLFESQMITINVELETTQQIGHQKTYLKIYDITNGINNLIENQPIVMPNEETGTSVFIENRQYDYFFDKNKDYKIELIMPGYSILPDAITTINSNTSMRGFLSLQYKTDYNLVEGEGLRVKRISDFTENNSIANNTKRYYYTNIENVFKNPIDYVEVYKKPTFHNQVNLLKKCSLWEISNNTCANGEYVYYRDDFSGSIESHTGYTLSIHPTNYNQEIINNYKKITISHGGDNFENGGVEKEFYIDISNVVQQYHVPRIITRAYQSIIKTHSGVSWLNLKHGKQLNEKIFKKTADTLFKVYQRKNLLFERNLTFQQSFPGTIFNNFGAGYLYLYENAGIGIYEIWSKEIAIDRITETNYIDAVPIVWVGNPNPVSNPFVYQGWQIDDDDGDGIDNYDDEDYQVLIDNWTPSSSIDETNYRKIVTTTDYEYNSDLRGLPTKIKTSSSVDGESLETRNYYVDQAHNLVNINQSQIVFANNLYTANRTSSPIQVENYKSKDGVFNLLSTSRVLYEDYNGKILDSIIQTSKSYNELEDRVIFIEYDSRGNPLLVKMKDGSITKYVYNELDLVTRKIENFIGINPNPDNSGTDCQIWNSIYLDAMVTSYAYHPITHKIVQITDPRCNTIYYVYDAQHRLKYVKDNDGNILSKNEYSYQTQN